MTNKKLQLILLIGGVVGVLFSTLITIEKIHLLQDVAYVPPCSINPIISCGSVMKTPQASVFGFPNSLIGIAGFSVVATIGAALLAGASLKKWFWLGTQVGVTFAMMFVFWLFYQSVYNIQALCPYCMVVWAVTFPVFVYTTLHNMAQKHIKVPVKTSDLLNRHHFLILALPYVIVLVAIGKHFWEYWSTLI